MPWLVAVCDYCNSLFRGLSCFNLHKLQSIQNTLARIVINQRKYTHVTPILKQLHWLPIKYRCMFQTATLVYKFLHSGSPSYFQPILSLSCSYSTRCSHPGPCYVLGLMLTALLYVHLCLRVHQRWRLRAIKVHIRLD